MRSTLALVALAGFTGFIGSPRLHAQTKPAADSAAASAPAAIAAPYVNDRFGPAVRLPVLDDRGVPIPFHEIQGRVEGGGAGMVIGGLLGPVLGLAIGAVASSTITCGHEQGQELCSPQEDALQSVLLTIGVLTGTAVGMAVGWESDAVTWQEAIEQIRAERRAAAGETP